MNYRGFELPLGISVNAISDAEVNAFIDAGFHYFEIVLPASAGARGQEQRMSAHAQPTVHAILQRGLRPWSIHLPFGEGWDIADYDEIERAAAVNSLARLMRLTGDWGAKLFVLHGCLEPVADAQRPVRIARSISSIIELESVARTLGMHVALEDLPRSCLANSTVETRAIMQAAGYVPLCFDVNHLLNDSHQLFLSELARYVATTHLSDYDGLDERHWLPGEGIVPWRMVVDGLLDAGYRGPFLFELRAAPSGGLYSPTEIVRAFEAALK